MRIVMDTNVLYQALRNIAGASNYILQLIRAYRLDLALSIPVFLEYSDVLLRPNTLRDLKRTRAEIESVFDLSRILASLSPSTFSCDQIFAMKTIICLSIWLSQAMRDISLLKMSMTLQKGRN